MGGSDNSLRGVVLYLLLLDLSVSQRSLMYQRLLLCIEPSRRHCQHLNSHDVHIKE